MVDLGRGILKSLYEKKNFDSKCLKLLFILSAIDMSMRKGCTKSNP